MRLPFTHDQFLGVFGAYNRMLWPLALALWVVSFVAIVILVRAHHPPHRWLSGLLAGHWAWSGLAYHLAFFTAINPAAWLFGVLFLVQAALFIWSGVAKSQLQFSMGRSAWRLTGMACLAYALVYPLLNFAGGYEFPRVPTFGVPCPSTIMTAGFLVMATGPVGRLVVIPVVWRLVGGSAAFLLGVRTDLALIPAGAAMVLYALSSGAVRHAWQGEK
jgi:Family of unknown function (DUF6064)